MHLVGLYTYHIHTDISCCSNKRGIRVNGSDAHSRLIILSFVRPHSAMWMCVIAGVLLAQTDWPIIVGNYLNFVDLTYFKVPKCTSRWQWNSISDVKFAKSGAWNFELILMHFINPAGIDSVKYSRVLWKLKGVQSRYNCVFILTQYGIERHLHFRERNK